MNKDQVKGRVEEAKGKAASGALQLGEEVDRADGIYLPAGQPHDEYAGTIHRRSFSQTAEANKEHRKTLKGAPPAVRRRLLLPSLW